MFTKTGLARRGGAVLLTGILLCSPAARGEDVALTKGQSPSTAPAAKRSSEEILADVKTASTELRSVGSLVGALTDPAQRTQAAPKAIPILNRLLKLSDELAADSEPRNQALSKSLRDQLLPMLATFGDPVVLADLEKQTSDPDVTKALDAKLVLLQSNWFKASKDEPAQQKIADDAIALAKANPSSMDVAKILSNLSRTGAASPALSDRLDTALTENMKGEFVDQMKQRLASAKKMRTVEGKPLTISGKLVDGKEFSSDQWKGKVILVDFWATWCGPCLAELPRVKKAYADFHEKGFEILGVSNDYTAEALTKFMADDPKMPWPQLFDADAAKAHQWSPITRGFGINGIPTMFLIDKNGVCRTVTARANFEELIPKMLAE